MFYLLHGQWEFVGEKAFTDVIFESVVCILRTGTISAGSCHIIWRTLNVNGMVHFDVILKN